MNPNFAQVGQAFVQHYYQTFETTRLNLQALYQPQSMLSWEGEKFIGPEQIMDKLYNKIGPDTVVRHVNITALEAQPTSNMGVIVLVAGELSIDGAPGMKYVQVFVLMPNPANPQTYYVHNDIFRLLLE